MTTDVLNWNSGHLIDARWALWELDRPQKKDVAQTLLFTRGAIVHSASAACASASCKLWTAAAGVHLLLCFQPPIETCCLTTTLFIVGQRSLHWTTRRLTLWLTTGRLTSPARGHQLRLVAGGHRPGVEVRPELLTLVPDPASLFSVGSGLELRRRIPCREQWMSNYSVWLNQELCPALCWPPGPCSGLLLLATHQSAWGHAH